MTISNDYLTLRLDPDHYSGAHAIRLTKGPGHWRPDATLIGGPHDGTVYAPHDKIPNRSDDEFVWLSDSARCVVAGAARRTGHLSVHPLLRAFLET